MASDDSAQHCMHQTSRFTGDLQANQPIVRALDSQVCDILQPRRVEGARLDRGDVLAGHVEDSRASDPAVWWPCHAKLKSAACTFNAPRAAAALVDDCKGSRLVRENTNRQGFPHQAAFLLIGFITV